jgi:hypothetical protein
MHFPLSVSLPQHRGYRVLCIYSVNDQYEFYASLLSAGLLSGASAGAGEDAA